MPATSNNTLIRLMRGNSYTSEAWKPETGEPLLDMESGTLNYGDGETLGGNPINTCTTRRLNAPVDLDTCITWGRYVIDGDISGLPVGIETIGRFFLTVQSSELGSAEIWQTLQILDGKFQQKTYNRVTLDKGITWSSWKDVSGNDFSGLGSGASEGDGNLDHYVYSSESYVENIVNGPSGTSGCDAFLFTYRQNPESPYVLQKMILVGCPKFAGKEFIRYSTTGNQNWESPGFNWKEIGA